MKYHAHGLNLSSEIKFKELPKIPDNSPVHVNIILGDVEVPAECLNEGKNFKVLKNSIFLFYDDIAEFKIENGCKITVDTYPEVNEDLLRMFILGAVMGVLLYQRGGHILHSSCVNIDGSAVAFLGGSGYGKSTMAMAMYRQGYPVVSDDYASISFSDGVPMVTPGAPYLKLSQENIVSNDVKSPDILTKQHELRSNFIRTQQGFSTEKIQLKEVFILEPGDSLQLKKLEAHDAIQSLLLNSYAINLFNDQDRIHNLKNNALLVSTTPTYSLSIPRSLDVIGSVVKIIKKNMKGVKNPKSGY